MGASTCSPLCASGNRFQLLQVCTINFPQILEKSAARTRQVNIGSATSTCPVDKWGIKAAIGRAHGLRAFQLPERLIAAVRLIAALLMPRQYKDFWLRREIRLGHYQ